MNIQSFSIVVPNKACMNKCPYCVSRMVNSNVYPNLMDVNHPTYDYNVKEYMRRMKYVADNGCQTLMLTGTSEPQQNKQFLNTFALIHRLLGKPFTNIEMQTTGVLLDKNPDYLRFLKNFVGVNTMAISLSSLSQEMNSNIIGNNVDVVKLCHMLLRYGFNIRICCNLTSIFDLDKNMMTLLRQSESVVRKHKNDVKFYIHDTEQELRNEIMAKLQFLIKLNHENEN